MSSYVDQVFGARGLLAQRFPGYAPRTGQLRLTEAVDRALAHDQHLLGEAPCGVGKSIGYSVPAIWHAVHRERKVVIATANIALQDQLVRKDLPLLAEILPWPFRFAVLKGRQNYLCRARLDDVIEIRRRHMPLPFPIADSDDFDRLVAWADKTRTGDQADLGFAPSGRMWSEVSTSSDECQGNSCRYSDACFANDARDEAAEAHVIVTNYHLLFAHLQLRMLTGRDLLLPAFDAVICDEAHEMADIARATFGWDMSVRTMRRLVRDTAKWADATSLSSAGEAYFVALHRRSPLSQERVTSTACGESEALCASLDQIDKALERTPADTDERKAELEAVRRRARMIRERIGEGASPTDRDRVYWLERERGAVRLCSRPVDVAPLLHALLFKQAQTACLVSATLTTNRRFDFIRRETGIPRAAAELAVESPFDFRKQALLVLPKTLPQPTHGSFSDAVVDAVARVVDAADGRTLGLFTSHRMVDLVYQRVRGGRHRVLKQGDLPKAELLRVFRCDVSSVLLGTTSLWTGVDIPGEALSALVIDRLPFPRPDDPILAVLHDRDPDFFGKHVLPRTAIQLQQGVGRLIRSVSDRGVVVLLDRRVRDKAYGRYLLGSLPLMPIDSSIESIGPFLAGDQDAWAS
jgi:ATP-dependent DNA helicase DinG